MFEEDSDMTLNQQTWILSVCDDADLQFTRELVLRSEGYKVVSLRSRHVQPEWWLNNFDIAILCRTVECERAFEIATLLRTANPLIQMLRIDSAETDADGGQELSGVPHGSISSPGALLGAVRSLSAPQSSWRM